MLTEQGWSLRPQRDRALGGGEEDKDLGSLLWASGSDHGGAGPPPPAWFARDSQEDTCGIRQINGYWLLSLPKSSLLVDDLDALCAEPCRVGRSAGGWPSSTTSRRFCLWTQTVGPHPRGSVGSVCACRVPVCLDVTLFLATTKMSLWRRVHESMTRRFSCPLIVTATDVFALHPAAAQKLRGRVRVLDVSYVDALRDAGSQEYRDFHERFLRTVSRETAPSFWDSLRGAGRTQSQPSRT